MHRADQVVPGMPRRQLTNPVLVAGEVIHFQRQLDDQPGVIAPRPGYLLDVSIHIAEQHSPVVEIIARHWTVFRKSDFLQTQFDGLRRVLRRFPHRVATERRVHVIIGWQRHFHRVRHGSNPAARRFPSPFVVMAMGGLVARASRPFAPDEKLTGWTPMPLPCKKLLPKYKSGILHRRTAPIQALLTSLLCKPA